MSQLQLQLSAQVNFTAGGNFGVKTPIFELGANVSLSLQVAGSVTTTNSVTITNTMDNYAAYVFYDGSHKASGSFTHYLCNANGSAYYAKATGTATSYDVPTKGAVDCTTAPPSTSLGYLAKAMYC